MASLTPAQRRVLEAARDGRLGYMQIGNDYYLTDPDSDELHSVSPVARRQFAAGLIERVEYHMHGRFVMGLTPAGRSELGIEED